MQEFRQLSDHEVLLRHDLKVRILGLTAVEKLRLKQQSRLSAIRAAEANSKLFYLHANGRRRKNFIKYLNSNGLIKHTQQEKDCVYQHFHQQLGQSLPREYTIDWTTIHLNRCQLQHLEHEFSEEEVQHVVHQMQSDKAPGPDGFIWVFYKSC